MFKRLLGLSMAICISSMAATQCFAAPVRDYASDIKVPPHFVFAYVVKVGGQKYLCVLANTDGTATTSSGNSLLPGASWECVGKDMQPLVPTLSRDLTTSPFWLTQASKMMSISIESDVLAERILTILNNDSSDDVKFWDSLIGLAVMGDPNSDQIAFSNNNSNSSMFRHLQLTYREYLGLRLQKVWPAVPATRAGGRALAKEALDTTGKAAIREAVGRSACGKFTYTLKEVGGKFKLAKTENKEAGEALCESWIKTFNTADEAMAALMKEGATNGFNPATMLEL